MSKFYNNSLCATTCDYFDFKNFACTAPEKKWKECKDALIFAVPNMQKAEEAKGE